VNGGGARSSETAAALSWIFHELELVFYDIPMLILLL